MASNGISVNATISGISNFSAISSSFSSNSSTPSSSAPEDEVSLSAAERVFWCALMLAIAAGTTFGNALVMLALLLTRRLRRPWNMLLLSLAAGDFLIGLVAEPVSVYSFLVRTDRPTAVGEQRLQHLPFWCLFHWLDMLLGLASILNMLAISIDRYLLVTKPLYYSNKLRHVKFMTLLIAAVWTIAVLAPGSELPISFLFNGVWCVDPKHDGVLPFLIIVFVAFCAPIVIMAILWAHIALLAEQKARRRRKRAINTTQTVAKLAANRPEAAIGVLIENVGGADATAADDQQVALLKGTAVSSNSVINGNSFNLAPPESQSQSLSAKVNSENKAIKTVAIIIGCAFENK